MNSRDPLYVDSANDSDNDSDDEDDDAPPMIVQRNKMFCDDFKLATTNEDDDNKDDNGRPLDLLPRVDTV